MTVAVGPLMHAERRPVSVSLWLWWRLVTSSAQHISTATVRIAQMHTVTRRTGPCLMRP